MAKEAYLLLIVEFGREVEILETLRVSNYVDEAYILFGEYDIIAKVKSKDKETLDASIHKIKEMDCVGYAKTLEVADVVV